MAPPITAAVKDFQNASSVFVNAGFTEASKTASRETAYSPVEISLALASRTSAVSAKVSVENDTVDLDQTTYVRNGYLFIDLVHGPPDKPEFRDRAMILDETGRRKFHRMYSVPDPDLSLP